MERTDVLELAETTGKVSYTLYMMYRYSTNLQGVYPPFDELDPHEREAWRQAEIGVTLAHKLREAVRAPHGS